MVLDNTGTTLKRAWWHCLLIGLAAVALILSAIMSWHKLVGGEIAGCTGGSPCEQVLSSRWSMIAGIIPVSGLAVGCYLAIITASLFIGPSIEESTRRLAWSVMLILAGSVAGSAIWFTILQKWIIGDFCPYCMTVHITGFLLSALIIWRAAREFKSNSTDPPLNSTVAASFPRKRSPNITGLVLAGMSMAGIIAASQLSFKPSAVYIEGRSEENPQVIDFNDVPMIGSPDAQVIVKMLFDYQCSHCQKLYFMLGEAVSFYKGKLAFALLPSPLDNSCNPYVPPEVTAFKNSCELARIGLAVWIADQRSFEEFENWMFTFETGNSWLPRSPEASMAKAVDLVGRTKFDAALNDPGISQLLGVSTQLYGQTVNNGRGGIPKLILGSRWVIPEAENAHDLVKIIQESLAVPVP